MSAFTLPSASLLSQSVLSGIFVGALFVPVPELITLVLAVAISLAVWAVLRYSDLGRALRAAAEDAPIAAAFGVNERANSLLLAGTCAALASIAGVCLALSFTLA